MAKPPVQQVRDRFGDKVKLAELLISKLERPKENEGQEAFARRIRTMSNKKLLRLFEAHSTVETTFGSKAGLIDAIMKLRQPTGNPDLQYRSKLETYRITRLLDMHRSLAKK